MFTFWMSRVPVLSYCEGKSANKAKATTTTQKNKNSKYKYKYKSKSNKSKNKNNKNNKKKSVNLQRSSTQAHLSSFFPWETGRNSHTLP